MLEDIRKVHDQLGDTNAVLVVGDIAARGKRADYDVAASFLDRTCELVVSQRNKLSACQVTMTSTVTNKEHSTRRHASS